jgi:predicted ATPase
MAIAIEQDFGFFVAFDKMLRGWALAVQGQQAQGIAQLGEGLSAYQATGANALQVHWLSTLAEVHGKASQVEEGLDVLTDALDQAEQNHDEQWFDAELYRIKGELLWQRSRDKGHNAKIEEEVEDCFRQAIEIAQRQGAKSWHLRAAMSLGRLWRKQNKKAKALSLLQDIYDWFTEGFETADLKEAKALLEDLSSAPMSKREL